ncbi:hypothetical protein AK812_SmicGene14161 [Symbiodinium microadriaticum]|uniref:Uncharacterized protein n=1 Tax=Symbiodinium microadriaticum TaxID=2951 RepID=A0A1Q9E698_SYMMI|nr:hypothetical protein AK812_SmicGene14161 [Symbiodinium microadriaticum]
MEGLTGGAMLAMVSTAMLPEAFKGAGDRAGLLFVLGFGLSVWITCLGYRFGSPQQQSPFFKGSCAAAACPAHSSGDSVVKGCTCNDGYWGSIAAQVGKPFYSGSCTAFDCNAGTGSSCKTCVDQPKRKQDNHCSSCNDGYTIFEPQCKVMASDQKCGGPTCAKACKGDKCGFKCAGTLAGQEECAAECQGEQCGFQCSGGNCASTCQGNQCAYECQSTASDVQQCGKECKGFECGYYCQGAECARSCSGDRCGAYCSGEYGQLGNCAAKCVGRQCGFECIGHQCAAECQGSRCAYRCQGDLQEIGSCGLKCQGPECAFSCQGSACAQQCTGDRCGKSCQSGTSGDQSCAKQCKGEECGALCVGATCAKSCEGDFCAFQCSGKLEDVEKCGAGCKGVGCAASCQGSECAKGCTGERCGAGCSGTSGSKSHCAAGCVGRRCAANCKGAFCGAGCKGEGCAMGCEGENCDQGCTGTNCGKGATPAATCKEELQKNPKLCGLRATFNDEVVGLCKVSRLAAFALIIRDRLNRGEFRFSDSRMKFHFSFGFLRLLPCLAYKFREPHIPASQIQYVQELTVALPLAVINLTNCTQLLRDGNLVGGNITFRASDFGHDVPFVMDKAAGFYAILDDVLSRATDGNPCFHEDLRSYMACIVAASCVIQAAVPAYVSMEVYAMILEQVTRFEEITWPLLRDALDHEEGSTLASDILLPEAFVCDGSEHDPSFLQLDSDSHEASQRLISELGTEHMATASMALALRVAAANSHQILDSHATNGSLDATIEKLQHVWHPVCQQLGCDHTNFWDIYLQHHKHSMAVIKTNHAGLLRSDIKLRFHLEQRVQRSQFLDPDSHSKPGVQEIARQLAREASPGCIEYVALPPTAGKGAVRARPLLSPIVRVGGLPVSIISIIALGTKWDPGVLCVLVGKA